LAIVDAYIGFIFGNMTISHDISINKLTLYPPSKPNIDQEMSICLEGEDSDDEESAHQLLRLD
jgi:hypothetical protein